VADCALAVGFEKMEKGSLGVKYTDRTNALDKHATAMFALREPEASPAAPQMFGNAGRDHMEKYGSEPDHYARIGWQLRGRADARQVEGAEVGLQHNIGLGGACVVTVYKPVGA